MADPAPVLEHGTSEPPFDLGAAMRLAAADGGKSPWAQLREIWRLRFGPGKLLPQEYYYYRLYDDRRLTFADKRRFMGRATWQRIYQQCNPLDWWAIAHDKLVFSALAEGLGLPHPRTLALYHATRSFNGAVALRDRAGVAAFLRTRTAYPLFAKPVTGIRSAGVAALDDYDRAGDALVLRGGRRVGIEAFVDEIDRYAGDGYVFQEPLRPHPALARVCGPRLSTVRLVVALEPTGAQILFALWKVPVGANPADNFWRPGNLLALLDIDSGEVRRMVRGAGPAQEEVEQHPDTGATLSGLALPDWAAAVDLSRHAACAVPGLRLQAWDVALTDHGPVLVEVNIGGDFNLPQLAAGRGLMDARFESFLEACAPRAA